LRMSQLSQPALEKWRIIHLTKEVLKKSFGIGK